MVSSCSLALRPKQFMWSLSLKPGLKLTWIRSERWGTALFLSLHVSWSVLGLLWLWRPCGPRSCHTFSCALTNCSWLTGLWDWICSLCLTAFGGTLIGALVQLCLFNKLFCNRLEFLMSLAWTDDCILPSSGGNDLRRNCLGMGIWKSGIEIDCFVGDLLMNAFIFHFRCHVGSRWEARGTL